MISRVRTAISKLRSSLAARRQDNEFDQELEEHLRLLTEKYVREGMTSEEARYAARRQFGNVTSLKEVRTEMLTLAPVRVFFRDLKFGVRLLARTPGWTAAALLTLTLGIGANTAIFSLVQAVLLRDLPYPDAGRLVVPATIFQRYKTDRGSVAYADFLDWRAETAIFEAVSVYTPSSADLTGGEEPERVRALAVDDAYFGVMGTAPHLGRFFSPEENLRNGPPAVVLAHSLWLRRCGGTRT